MPSSSEIRQQFIDFFCKKHGHKNVPSSPVVPLGDPTLLFANAGMNQFKPYFLGTEKPPVPRVANTQKCIRAGGKHNDLDDVGKDTYHHTFFEMLGNWSFGDYFKKEAITWAWELLTDVWKLDPTRLHVTVFEGDPANGIPRDDEAAGFWKDVGVPPERIHLGNKKDNFWEMGNTGPCGPCTEIHFDATPNKTGGPLVNQSSDQVIEIWNLVFIQFNRNEDQSLTPLPAQHVDTGMGFERITKVIQGKSSNYETDIFTPLLASIGNLFGQQYKGTNADQMDTAFRVIADHIRMLTFAITDGALPGNKGRGSVVRSVLRRAVRFGWLEFGQRTPKLHQLVHTVTDCMGDAFPELKQNPIRVAQIIEKEEADFLGTIERGIRRFDEAVSEALAQSVSKVKDAKLKDVSCSPSRLGYNRIQFEITLEKEGEEFEVRSPHLRRDMPQFVRDTCGDTSPVISGEAAFRLYTQDGFPLDLTRQMASEWGFLIDEADYQRRMAEHEGISRAGATNAGLTAFTTGSMPKTDDSAKYKESLESTGRITHFFKGDTILRDKNRITGEDGEVTILLDETNFYAEQGGQVGDRGNIKTETGLFTVQKTARVQDAVLHIGVVSEGHVELQQPATLLVDPRRVDIMRNHTATHLLNLALCQVLGGQVDQKGSLVDDSKTRFDFSHDRPITAEQLQEIERRVNRSVIMDQVVTAKEMPLEEAKKLPGLRAVFGEKYPDPVRVVMIGTDDPSKVTADLSTEFCGGTHMPRTGLIGYFKIVSQEAVAKGVRRITGITGRPAYAEVQTRSALVDDLSTRFQCRPEELPARVEALQNQVKKLQDQLKKGAAADVAATVDKLLDAAPAVGETKLIVGQLPADTAIDAVRTQIDRIRQKAVSAFIVFGWTEEGGKVPLVVALTSDLVKKGIKAGDIVKQLAAIVGGSGGGKPDYAQAGGKDAAKLPEALKKAEEIANGLLK